MIIAGGRTLPEREALDRYRLPERVSRYASGRLSGPDAEVRVVDGDLRIDGDLELDTLGYAGLIVEGHLDVTGSIIDAHSLPCCKSLAEDGIPFLLVAGNLRARNVVIGSSQLCVEGDAGVEDLLLLHNIGSTFKPVGTLRARRIVHTYEPEPGFPLSEHLHRDVEIDSKEECGVAVENVDATVLIERLRAGLPVLRDSEDPRPRKSYERWLADCATYGDVLKHVPRELIDEAMCLAAVKSYGHAIAYVPRELVTDELVDAAIAENPWARESVPTER